ncbi:MAG: hypothetical protein KIT14_11205 [bacterium]|nr:hypothetical protein [bacterium]
MTRSRPALALTAALTAVVLGACTPVAPPPPGPAGVARIAVDTPVNQTGQELVIDDRGLLSGLLGEKRSTLPDILAGDLRKALARRGFTVVTGASGSAPALRVDLKRWEPYTADYSTVTVDLTASLVDGGDGRTLWTITRTGWQVPTDQPRSSLEASLSASQFVAQTLVENWQPAGATASAR